MSFQEFDQGNTGLTEKNGQKALVTSVFVSVSRFKSIMVFFWSSIMIWAFA